jgi:hypothetical protein
MTESGNIHVDIFVKWLEHFQKNKAPVQCLITFDGRVRHWEPIHELVSCIKVSSFPRGNKRMESNRGRNVIKEKVGKIFALAWSKSAMVHIRTNGIRSCGIMPCVPDVIPWDVFENSVAYGAKQVGVPKSSPVRKFSKESPLHSWHCVQLFQFSKWNKEPRRWDQFRWQQYWKDLNVNWHWRRSSPQIHKVD